MRRINLAWLAAVSFLICTAPVSAQTACPVGTPAGSATCGPSGGGEMASPPPRPTGEWLKTWGAIATSSSGGGGGQFTTAATVGDAKARALKLCQDRFRQECKVAVSECSDPVFRRY